MANLRYAKRLLLTAPFALSVTAAQAFEPDDHDHRAHEAHIHGAWELFAALDDKQLSVTLTGPLVDALGFETIPDTDEERTAVTDLHDRLKSFEMMLTLDELARCKLSQASAVFPEGFSTENAKAQHDDHDDHDHDEHDGHEEHDNHDAHSNNLEVTYVFDCASPARLRAITMTAFDTFPTIENIDAVFLSDAKQLMQHLEPKKNALTLD